MTGGDKWDWGLRLPSKYPLCSGRLAPMAGTIEEEGVQLCGLIHQGVGEPRPEWGIHWG